MIVISEFMNEEAVQRMSRTHRVHYDAGLWSRRAALGSALADASALIVRNNTKVTEELLACANGLKCIGRLGVGLDNIDQSSCRDRDVTVYPASGANDQSVAEYVIACIFILLRKSFGATEELYSGAWPRGTSIGSEIHGKTLGIIGFGSIGRLTSRIASGLGMRVIACDPNVPTNSEYWSLAEKVEIDELMARAQVISVHVPYNRHTHHILSERLLAKARPGAVLINASRGGVVDEHALLRALKSGFLGGAAMDVYEQEPMTADYGKRFEGVDNLILTPHIAGITRESNIRVSNMIADAVLAHLDSSD